MTEKLMTYALGRGLDYRDMPAVRTIVRDAARDDYQVFQRYAGHCPQHAVSNENGAGGGLRSDVRH